MTRLRSPATGASFGAAGLLAAIFLALHLPYLPQSLEDLDSINFAMGVRQFDVAHHQPHPPGYPVFIAIAKAVHAAGASDVAALALISVVAGALGVIAIAALFRRLDAPSTATPWRVMPVAVAVAAPLYWFTAVRPLSDAAGLAAAVALQALTLAAGSTSALTAAAFGAGLAAGLRSQVLWLTVPLLVYRALPRPKSLIPLGSAFAVGVLVWFVPLVILSGGASAYWHALFDQGAEDLGNIQMLWTMHGVRDVREALYYAFVAPWAAWPLAAAVLVCAGLGIVRLARAHSRALTILAIAFVPYLVFDLLFQETFTVRYALPLVVPIAYLAVAGLRLVPYDLGLAGAIAVAMFSAHVGGTSIAAYSRVAAPVFRMLNVMRSQAGPRNAAPVLAPDRRQTFDLRGPRKLLGDGFPAVSQTLAAPPQHEWLEAVKYWNSGGKAPLWFVVDPLRASIDLVQHQEPLTFRWHLPYPVLLGGTRPNEMDWYRVDRPEWYVGEGWALTPESAGVAAVDRRGPSLAPVDAWLRRDVLGGALMIGGRNLDPSSPARLSVLVEDHTVADATLAPGAFLRIVDLPVDLVDVRNPLVYPHLTVQARGGSPVAIEQFDASASRPMFGFGAGWQEPELNPATGVRWRWLSERGEIRVWMPVKRLSPDRLEYPAFVLHLEGESPLTYFSRPSQLTVRVGTRQMLKRILNDDFSLDVPLGMPSEPIVLETDQVFSPADRSRRSADRRHLGLRVFKAELRKASPAS